MNKVRTRFAPSPTGYMHIGNLRTALFTYLIAKQNGGDFILRIEDTDQERYVDGAVEVIYKTLKDVGLNWDEGPDIGGPVGPYIQSQRMGMFKKYAEELVEKGEAYYCFCDKERLEEVRAIQEASGIAPMYDRHCRNLSPEEIKEKLDAGVPYVIRQKIPTEGEVTFHDELYGDITVDCSTLDDQILIKTDGMPTYNFANVVDDHLMGITHVVRGNEYLASAPKYNLLYKAFGWEIPTYIHGLSKSPAIFDPAKLKAINGKYIKAMTPEKFAEYAIPYIKQSVHREDVDLNEIAKLLQARTELFTEIPEMVDFIDALPEYDIALYTHKKMKTNPENSLESLKEVLPVLEGVEDWTEENIHDALFDLIGKLGVKNGIVLWPLRVAVSGKAFTPGGGVEISYLIGKEDTLARIRKGIEKLS